MRWGSVVGLTTYPAGQNDPENQIGGCLGVGHIVKVSGGHEFQRCPPPVQVAPFPPVGRFSANELTERRRASLDFDRLLPRSENRVRARVTPSVCRYAPFACTSLLQLDPSELDGYFCAAATRSERAAKVLLGQGGSHRPGDMR